ncbi:MAG: hypothetical protein KF764_25825 [Labilithrix sp.]|nr:hypothetical protein [Labilithrix sp.]MBX3224242.1 hypothetical protein [Labilithrix sp.]
MRRLVAPLALAGVALVVPRAEAADAGAPAPARPACIGVATDARWVPYGYDHVVVLANRCDRAATCAVATDVNPEERSVDVPAGRAVELTTFMASPSATFVARVSCALR